MRSRATRPTVAFGCWLLTMLGTAPVALAEPSPVPAAKTRSPPPETKPAGPDEDGDGIPDEEEDRNHDNRLDADETDPRTDDTDDDGVKDGDEVRFHTDPRLINIPEPLYFDMIRGLGARRGELEFNTLVTGFGRLNKPDIGVGPEVEYVFLRGHAIEVEFPLSTAKGLLAWKAGLQGTLPYSTSGRFIHGWLVTGELLRETETWKATPTYVAAYRFNRRWSVLGMAGARIAENPAGGKVNVETILNPNAFFDISPWVTVGVEVNHAHLLGGSSSLVVLPQVHWQPARWLKLQAGAGVQTDRGDVGLASGVRASVMTF